MSKDIAERCEDAISSLMQEIATLKGEYKENQREIALLSETSIKNSLGPFQKDNGEGITTITKNVNTQLAHGEKEMKFFIEVSGIEILQHFKKTEQKNEKVVHSHKLMGRCHFLPFELTFVTTEIQSEACWMCDVTQVNVHMDCKGKPDLTKLVERTEATMSLQGFFRTLSKYAEWCEFRMKTFAHFEEHYSAAVTLPHGSSGNYMVLANPEVPQCEMILVWEITINERGAVIPILDLLPKLPEEAIALDKSGVLEDTAPAFKNLLQVFGIQSSIEKIIHSFCLEKATRSP
ncbi:PREDICTED: centromere protein P [Nanorana parkeri]|uniref:centromere protein P n=1 Tax=Nanorana parkeri TaxID=125878 RepID=UPI000854720A|nr:PREDICTED: centromere protein P [Nanorana parkeri]